MAAELVRLNSTGTKKDGKKTGYFKTTKIDKKKMAGKNSPRSALIHVLGMKKQATLVCMSIS